MSIGDDVDDGADVRAEDLPRLNAAMAERLLASPAAPLREGGYALRVLQTRGRRTRRVRRTPVGVLRRGGRSYLVCPNRTRDWAQNLLTDPRCVIRAGGERGGLRAVPVDGEEAIETIAAYLSVVRVPWARAAFGLGEAADREHIAAGLPTMAVFRLESAGGGEAA